MLITITKFVSRILKVYSKEDSPPTPGSLGQNKQGHCQAGFSAKLSEVSVVGLMGEVVEEEEGRDEKEEKKEEKWKKRRNNEGGEKHETAES